VGDKITFQKPASDHSSNSSPSSQKIYLSLKYVQSFYKFHFTCYDQRSKTPSTKIVERCSPSAANLAAQKVTAYDPVSRGKRLQTFRSAFIFKGQQPFGTSWPRRTDTAATPLWKNQDTHVQSSSTWRTRQALEVRFWSQDRKWRAVLTRWRHSRGLGVATFI